MPTLGAAIGNAWVDDAGNTGHGGTVGGGQVGKQGIQYTVPDLVGLVGIGIGRLRFDFMHASSCSCMWVVKTDASDFFNSET